MKKTNKTTIPPVTRLCVITGDCNGPWKIVTDFASEKEQTVFHNIYLQWFHHPETRIWHITDFIRYFKNRFPNRMCVLHEDYLEITKGKVIHATKEEWDAENIKQTDR